MNTTARYRANDRDRSLARLQALTVGTAVVSAAAVGAFGALAAWTHPGKTALGAASATSEYTTANGGVSSTGTTDASSAGSSTTSSFGSSTVSGFGSFGQASSVFGGAQVTSGGS